MTALANGMTCAEVGQRTPAPGLPFLGLCYASRTCWAGILEAKRPVERSPDAPVAPATARQPPLAGERTSQDRKHCSAEPSLNHQPADQRANTTRLGLCVSALDCCLAVFTVEDGACWLRPTRTPERQRKGGALTRQRAQGKHSGLIGEQLCNPPSLLFLLFLGILLRTLSLCYLESLCDKPFKIQRL